MTLTRTWIGSGNYSNRSASVRILVIHTTEGFTGLNGMYDCGYYFQGNVGASSHVVIDNYHPNHIVECVNRKYASWTQCNYNSHAISVEQCGYASYSRDKWLGEFEPLLKNTAAWLAEESAYYGIPLVDLSSSQAQGSGKGVCYHSELGSAGCGHSDPGSGYPLDVVLQWAKGETTPAPKPEEDMPMVATAWWNNKLYMAGVATDGKVKFWESGTWFNVDKEQGGAKLGSASLTIGPTGDRVKFVVGYVNGSGAACTYECEEDSHGKNAWRWSSKSNGGVFA